MKKIALTEPGRFSLIDARRPEISGDYDVMIKIAAVGICGSDIHYFRTGRIGDQVIKYPFTPGHEFAGIVAGTGTGVGRVQRGDRVAIDPAVSCGTCDQCRLGREHTCRNLLFTGNPDEKEGALQEYIVAPEKCCFRLPENVTVQQGIIAEPLTIALHAVGLDRGYELFGILGSGPIGICVFKVLKLQNPEADVYMTDKIETRIRNAQSMGARWAGNPLNQDIVAEIQKLNPPGLQAVLECCGQQEAIDQAVDLLGPGGELVITGIPEVDVLTFNPHDLRRKELSIRNVRRQNGRFEQALKIISEHGIDFNGFITHSFRPDKVQEAFELVENYRDGVIKAVIEFA